MWEGKSEGMMNEEGGKAKGKKGGWEGKGEKSRGNWRERKPKGGESRVGGRKAVRDKGGREGERKAEVVIKGEGMWRSREGRGAGEG